MLAFPTAVGAGKDTVGGRGGALCIVNTLADNGTGSYNATTNTYTGDFRYCLLLEVPRIITFTVSGTIVLSGGIFLDNNSDTHTWDNFTILGQTAPLGGITIHGYVWINNVQQQIWRYIRIRQDGATAGWDALTLNATSDVIVDNCSLSYGSDESLSVTSSGGRIADRITFSNNILIANKTGSIIGSNTDGANGYGYNPRNTNVTFYNNVFIDTSHRFPNVLGSGKYEIINNCVYNWQARAIRAVENPNINHINNYYKAALDGLRSDAWFGLTGDLRWQMHKVSYTPSSNTSDGISPNIPSIYTKGNLIMPNNLTDADNGDNKRFWTTFYGSEIAEHSPVPSSCFTDTQHILIDNTLTINTAQNAYNTLVVSKEVGARFTLDENGNRQAYMDSVDSDYLDSFINDTGSFTNYLNRSLFVYPIIPSNTPNTSTLNDVIPDAWRASNMNGEDYNDINPSTMRMWIEDFANEVDGDIVIVDTTSVTIAPQTADVQTGSTVQLTETVLPSNASDKTGIWSSNNANATVDVNGLVTGVTEGSSVVTFTTNDGSFTDTTIITVVGNTNVFYPLAGSQKQSSKQSLIALSKII